MGLYNLNKILKLTWCTSELILPALRFRGRMVWRHRRRLVYHPAPCFVRMVTTIINPVTTPPVRQAVAVLATEHPVQTVGREIYLLCGRPREQFRVAGGVAVLFVRLFGVTAVVFAVTYLLNEIYFQCGFT